MKSSICSRRAKSSIFATIVKVSMAGVGPVEKLRGGSSNCHCALSSWDVANMVEKHSVHSTALGAAGESPVVGVRVPACFRSAEEADNI